jgi:putative ABC transport system permease protein
VRYKNDATGALLAPRFIRTVANTQAAVPALEAARLNTMLGAGAGVLSGLGYGLLALSAFGFFVALFAAVQTRQRDLVLLRTLGARSPLILCVTALEAMLLGLLGGVAGLGLGRGAASVAAHAIARNDGPVLALAPVGALDGLAIGAAIAIALIAAIAPAMIAARIQPAAALKSG